MTAPNPAKAKIEIPHESIAEFCRRWKVAEFALFGSVLRDDFSPTSDVDLLISFAPDAQLGLFGLVEMQNELKRIFNREVDLVSRRGIEARRNYLRRKAILNSARVVYTPIRDNQRSFTPIVR